MFGTSYSTLARNQFNTQIPIINCLDFSMQTLWRKWQPLTFDRHLTHLPVPIYVAALQYECEKNTWSTLIDHDAILLQEKVYVGVKLGLASIPHHDEVNCLLPSMYFLMASNWRTNVNALTMLYNLRSQNTEQYALSSLFTIDSEWSAIHHLAYGRGWFSWHYVTMKLLFE